MCGAAESTGRPATPLTLLSPQGEVLSLDTFWQIVTAIGVVVTAVIAALDRYMRYYDTPPVLAEAHAQPPITGNILDDYEGDPEDLPHIIDFHLNDADAAKWMIAAARVRGMQRRPILTVAAQFIQDGFGDGRWLSDGSWQRRVVFEPPLSKGQCLLHRDVHGPFTVLFTVRLRAQPRVRRRVPVRCCVAPHGSEGVDGLYQVSR